jgi:hypothetical protein
VGNYPKTRQNKNINFGVTKESEEMLIKNRVSSPSRVKKGGIQITICEKYSNCSRKNGEGKKK